MSQTAQDVPEHIQALLKQQEEINILLLDWKKEQEEKKRKEELRTNLEEFTALLSKKRNFYNIKTDFERPKKLARCFHNIGIIQQKEKDLCSERARIKEDCLKDLQDYLDS